MPIYGGARRRLGAYGGGLPSLPAGYAFLVDDDGAYLVDSNGDYLIAEVS